jgi:serine protease Do
MWPTSVPGTVLAGLAVWALVSCSSASPWGGAVSTNSVTPLPAATDDALDTLETAFEHAYARTSPSVVMITGPRATTDSELEAPPGMPFRPAWQAPLASSRLSLGSGFVWDTQGHIVTNHHVVAGTESISVTFDNDLRVPARVVGADPASDLAVLRVDVPSAALHPVELGDSSTVHVGHIVLAVGNPFGKQHSITVGIISAVGRTLPSCGGIVPMEGQSQITDVLQTDTALNPGNSGGVLIDVRGRLIGVTTAFDTSTETSAGVGYAIPANLVRLVVPELISHGYYEHPWLGLLGTPLTAAQATTLGLAPSQQGMLVQSVMPGGPADAAGLHGSVRESAPDGTQRCVDGDLIVAIDGTPVASFGDISAYLARSGRIGATVTLTILRHGQRLAVPVVIAAQPAVVRK